MIFLNKFKFNPLDLVGQDLSKAPTREIDLSGTKLSFICPPQTAQFPAFMGSNNFDIYTAPEPEPHNEYEASALIFSSGWNFYDRVFMGTSYGGLDINIVLLRNLEGHEANNSLLNTQIFFQWVCESNELIYGRKNKEKWENRNQYAVSITPEKSFWRYPKSTDDLQWHKFCGHEWVSYETYQPGYVPDTEFETAITHQHVISVSWSPSAIEFDYFTPTHNLRAAIKELMNAIMSSMEIELSSEAKERFIEVENI